MRIARQLDRRPGSFGPTRWTLRGFMIALAALTVTAWATREASIPAYEPTWIHTRYVVPGPGLVAPLSDSRSAIPEVHIRDILADDLLGDAVPHVKPEVLRGRLRAWCDPPDKVFVSLLTDDPNDRAALDRIGDLYVTRHKARRWHGATPLGPPSYPQRNAMVVGLAGFWASALSLALAVSIGRRRREQAQLLALR